MTFSARSCSVCLPFSLALALVACRPAGEPASSAAPATPAADQAATSTAGTPEATAPAAATDSLVAAPATATSPAPSPAPAPSVLATSDGERAGARVEVVELKRSSGDTLSLKFVLVNDADKDFSMANYLGNSGIGSDYRSVGGAHLVDATGKKKYLVVRDSETYCVCSREVQDVEPKSRVNLWAKFPAPPADVQRVNIVIPHFGPMDDVAISP